MVFINLSSFVDKIDTHRNKYLLQIQENVEMIFKLLGLE